MRVLLATHSAATHTSLGIVCREIWTRLLAADPTLEVVQHGWFHHPIAEEVPWDILPTNCLTLEPGPDGQVAGIEDMYGDQSFRSVAEKVKPDVIWHLGDPYMGMEIARVARELGCHFIYYYPVAREPFNHFRSQWVEKLAAADLLVTATRYGADILRAIPGFEAQQIPHIYLGVDTQTFRPESTKERAALREEISAGLVGDDTFVLGWVGHDQFRKQVWVLYELLYRLRSGTYIRCCACGRITVREYDHLSRAPRETGRLRTYEPDYDYRRCWYCGSENIKAGEPRNNIVLFTVMANNLEVGWDLRLLVDTFGLHDVVFDSMHSKPEAGYTTGDMAQIYNCFDALVFPSGAEGFGMPVLEAMACGVPVIYSNYSAHAEFAVGRPVRVRLVPDVPDPSFLGFVDMGDLIANTLALVEDERLRHRLALRALDKARTMDWDAFTPLWQDLLATSLGETG